LVLVSIVLMKHLGLIEAATHNREPVEKPLTLVVFIPFAQ